MAIASRRGIEGVVANFGEPLRPAETPEVGDDEPLAEARILAATCGGVRVVTLYAPNGRVVGSSFYEAKLVWYERLARWLEAAADPEQSLVLGGDFNVAPEDADVWDAEGLPRRDPRLAAGEGGVSRASGGGVSRTPTAGTIPSRSATPGGTTARGTSTRTSA